MEIYFHAEEVAFPLGLDRQKTKKWIESTILAEGKKGGILNYIFCSDPYIHQINKEYINHDYYTDIITFDYSENENISGDIFISLETVSSNAIKFSQSIEKELNRVIIHGILHLLGYADKTKIEKKQMTQKEDQYLSVFDQIK